MGYLAGFGGRIPGAPPFEETPHAYPPGNIEGFALTWLSVVSLSAAPGSCRDSTDTADINSSGTLTGTIAISGANGLDTGVEAANTWYAFYAIAKADGTVASLLSASFTAPTLPAGYLYFRRLGAVRNTATSNFFKFYQVGTRFYFDDPAGTDGQVISTSAPAIITTTIDCTSVAPPLTVKTIICFETWYKNSAPPDVLTFYTPGDASAMRHVRPGVSIGSSTISSLTLLADENQDIEYKCSQVTNSLTMKAIFYEDQL